MERPCRLTIGEKEYDVSRWVDHHPGGDVILAYHGADATEVFYAFHGADAVEQLQRMRSEPVAGGQTPQDEREARIVRDFDQLTRSMRLEGLFTPSWSFYAAKTLSTFGLGVAGALLHVYYAESLWWLSVLLFGLFWQQSGWLSHEYNHYQVLGSRGLLSDVFCYFTGPVWQGFSVLWWRDRHNKHHASSNVLGDDPDIDNLPVFAWDDADLARIGPVWGEQAPLIRRIMRYQHIYFLPFVTLLHFIWQFQTILFVRGLKTERNVPLRQAYIKELACLVAHYIGMAVLSLSCGSLLYGLRFYVGSALVGGLCIAWVVFLNHYACTHFHGAARRPNWVELQMRSSRNIASSPFMDWFAGGLNFQIEHHLWPTLPRHSLKRAQVLVRKFAADHDIPYQEADFIGGMGLILAQLRTVAGHLSRPVE